MATDNSNGNGNGDAKVSNPWAFALACIKGNAFASGLVLLAAIYFGPLFGDVLKSLAETQRQQTVAVEKISASVQKQDQIHDTQVQLLRDVKVLTERIVERKP